MTKFLTDRNMRTFFLIWLGQLVSIIGSGISQFALGIWVYDQTGSATQFALVLLFMVVPQIVLSPVAGVIADRYDRRWVMIFSDGSAGVATIALLLILLFSTLQIWQVYIIVFVIAIGNTIQFPAYSASISMLVPKEELGRANGLTQFAWAASQIIAPLLGGFLIAVIGLQGIVIIDFVTFLAAVGTLFLVTIPQPEPSKPAQSDGKKPSFFGEAMAGWTYIKERPGLLGLLTFFAIINLSVGFVQALLTPLILSFASEEVLGIVIGISSAGLVVGTVLLTTWGGPKRRIHGILGWSILFGVCIIFMGARDLVWLIAAAGFVYHLCQPILNGSNMAIWQTKVPPNIQGRVFATVRMIAWSTGPIAFVVSGLLADGIFNPLLLEGGDLAGSIGQIIGTGPGRGMGLLLIIMGVIPVAAGIWGYLYAPLRNVEDDLPDMVDLTPATSS